MSETDYSDWVLGIHRKVEQLRVVFCSWDQAMNRHVVP